MKYIETAINTDLTAAKKGVYRLVIKNEQSFELATHNASVLYDVDKDALTRAVKHERLVEARKAGHAAGFEDHGAANPHDEKSELGRAWRLAYGRGADDHEIDLIRERKARKTEKAFLGETIQQARARRARNAT